MRKILNAPTRVFILALVAMFVTACDKDAAPAREAAAPEALAPDDPQRFLKVGEWSGTLSTGAGSAGEARDEHSTRTWNSSISVRGQFRLKPYEDPKIPGVISWRGKGEAAVRVVGRRKTQDEMDTITDTYNGDYVDTFTVEITHLDFVKGTYQMSVVLDRWQEQPHKGQAIHLTSVKSNKYGTWTSTSMQGGHAWAGDDGAGIGREMPLPKSDLTITGSLTSNNDDFMSEDGSHWITNWTIHPVGPEFDEPLKAVAGGPYSVERGGSLTLDGLQSTGKIRSYVWKFEPADPGSPIPFNTGSAKEGRRVPAVFLATVKATLTVSDGEKEDSDTVLVSVTPRDYRTPFVHRPGDRPHPQSIAPRRIKKHDIAFVGGENVCALDDWEHSNHRLHPEAVGNSWDSRGYTLKQVQDPGGPFDGDWFLDGYQIRIEREVLINKYILPGGPPPVSTAEPFYEANKALGNDPDAYLVAVRRHEMLHTELMKKALASNDPGPAIEALASKEKDAVKTQADKTIQASEDAIRNASDDPLPSIGYKGTVAFPDDATDRYISLEMAL